MSATGYASGFQQYPINFWLCTLLLFLVELGCAILAAPSPMLLETAVCRYHFEKGRQLLNGEPADEFCRSKEVQVHFAFVITVLSTLSTLAATMMQVPMGLLGDKGGLRLAFLLNATSTIFYWGCIAIVGIPFALALVVFSLMFFPASHLRETTVSNMEGVESSQDETGSLLSVDSASNREETDLERTAGDLLPSRAVIFSTCFICFFFFQVARDSTNYLIPWVSLRFGETMARAGLLFSLRAIMSSLLYFVILPLATSWIDKSWPSANRDITLSASGAFCCTLGTLIVAAAPNLPTVAFGFALSVLGSSMTVTLRSFLASNVQNAFSGRLFAGISMTGTIGSLVGMPIMGAAYSLGINYNIGLPFLVSAVSYTVSAYPTSPRKFDCGIIQTTLAIERPDRRTMGRGEVNAKVLRPRGRYSEVDTTSILLDAADDFIFTNDTDAQDIQEISMSHHYSPNSSIISGPGGDTRTASDVCDGTEPFGYTNDDSRRDHIHFAAELGSAVEEAVASIVTKHGGAGIDKSLAWEAIQSLARSKLDGLTGSLIAQGTQDLYTSNNFVSAAEASLFFSENAGFMNHDVPLMTDLDAFFQNEQPSGFESGQALQVPDLGNAIYDDGPFSQWQAPIPSPSSATITLPTNSPSFQEPWPDGNSVESSVTDSTRNITVSPSSRQYAAASKHVGQRLTIPPARHDGSRPRTSPRPSSKRSMSQAGRLMKSHGIELPRLQESPSIEGISLVRLALRFWAMQAVFFKYPWTIVKGASDIGMRPLNIPGCWFGKTLLPRLVNQQLDKAFEIRMDEVERVILEQLQDMILRGDRSTYWCAIFLTTFILLHSLEKDSWNMHAWEYEKNREGGTRWPLRRDPCDYYGQNKHIADTLTTYFRIVTNGHAPFAIDWTKSSNQGLLGKSLHARSLIEGIQKDLQNHQSSERELDSPNEFRRDDVESLNYHYTKRLILEQGRLLSAAKMMWSDACLALVFLGLMTLGDSITDSLLPALADDAHTQSGRWNLGTAALVLKGVSDIIGQFVIGYFLNTRSKHHAMNLNATSILVASLVTLLSLCNEQQWPILVAIVSPLVRCIGGGSHASAFLILAILHDQAPPHYRFASYYCTGAVSVVAQSFGPFFASILADYSHFLPGILSGSFCLIGFGIVDSLKSTACESNNSSHDESTSLLPNHQTDAELKRLSISATEYLSRCFGKKSLLRTSSLIFLPQVFFLMAICKSTRPLFKTYIQHRDNVSPSEAEGLWLLRTVMSVVIFGIILPGIVLHTAPGVSYPNSINLHSARISVLFISIGAFMIGLSGSLRSIIAALVINTLGVATDLSLLAFGSCGFSSSDAGTVMMTLASVESAGTLLGIGVLYPIYQWSINEDLPFLVGGVPYYICGSLYAVTAVVVWSSRTRSQANES
ncbi:unnamed protein product [Fusarium fujikuroi]|nr:unnamed protein product [Fusarium fujikuroi]